MTTAHRPTFDPARGKEAQRGPAYHQRLLPAHTHLKTRKVGQGGIGGLSSDTADTEPRNLRAELLTAESSKRPHPSPSDYDGGESSKRRAITHEATADGEEQEDPEARRQRILAETHDEDASSSGSDAKDSSSSEDEDEDSDDEAALRRELEKIKSERAAQKAKEDAAKAAKEQEEREFDIARGNPLLNGDAGGGGRDFGVKRRWDDDVVFKNQARGTEEAAKRRGKEFVNDALRSDFHRRFMSRYVR